jgi:hypothetical protein
MGWWDTHPIDAAKKKQSATFSKIVHESIQIRDTLMEADPESDVRR